MSPENLEDRLTALLGDHRLDVPTRGDATGVVLGGVKRARRRRRVIQTAVPTVLVAMVAAAVVTVLPRHDQAPTPDPGILTAVGVGDLKIGMTIGEAETVRVIEAETLDEASAACQRYPGLGPVDQVSAVGGIIVRINVDAFADTDQGIHIGNTYADLENAYGDRLITRRQNPGKAWVSYGDTRYEFTLRTTDELTSLGPAAQITDIALTSTSHPCI